MDTYIVVGIVALGLLSCTCSKKSRSDSAGRPTPAGAPAAAPPAAKGETVARANSGARIDCEKLIPQGLRDKLFPGLSMTQRPLCDDCPEQCKFAKPGAALGPAVLYDCRGTLGSVSKPAMEAAGWKELSGLGRLAFTSESQVTFWDETDCQVTVSEQGAGQARLVEIAKAVEVPLTRASVGR